jgi:hypothetical protein
MNRCRFPLVLALLATMTLPASAGIIFGKRSSKPDPNERVPELLTVVTNDKDEHKRSAAVEELRQFDPVTFPAIVPTLIAVLENDEKSTVRAEAADSLGRIRPVSQQAGLALEQALAKDSSTRVRMQARYSLMQYHWAGYHTPPKDPPPPKETPGVSKAPPAPASTGTGKMTPVPTGKSPLPGRTGETSPPPLAPVPGPALQPAPPTQREGPDLDD